MSNENGTAKGGDDNEKGTAKGGGDDMSNENGTAKGGDDNEKGTAKGAGDDMSNENGTAKGEDDNEKGTAKGGGDDMSNENGTAKGGDDNEKGTAKGGGDDMSNENGFVPLVTSEVFEDSSQGGEVVGMTDDQGESKEDGKNDNKDDAKADGSNKGDVKGDNKGDANGDNKGESKEGGKDTSKDSGKDQKGGTSGGGAGILPSTYECSDFDASQSSTNEITFKYTIETKDKDYQKVLPDLEAAILDNVYGAVLNCMFIETSRRSLHDSEIERRSQSSNVFRITASPEDTLSSEVCSSENKGNSCNVINGKMIFDTEGSADVASARSTIVASVKESMDQSLYDNGQVHDKLEKVIFFGGNTVVLTSATSQAILGGGIINGPFLGTDGIVFLVLAFIVVFLIGLFYVKNRSNKNEKSLSSVQHDEESTLFTEIAKTPTKEFDDSFEMEMSEERRCNLYPINTISVHKCSSATCKVCAGGQSPKFINLNNRTRGRSLTQKYGTANSNTYNYEEELQDGMMT